MSDLHRFEIRRLVDLVSLLSVWPWLPYSIRGIPKHLLAHIIYITKTPSIAFFLSELPWLGFMHGVCRACMGSYSQT